MGGVPNGIGRIGISVKEAAVEEILLDAIGITKPKLAVIAQGTVDLRRAPSDTRSSYVFVYVLEDVLGVPNDKFETFSRSTLADYVPVVLRPIVVADPMVNNHVVDQIIEVHVLLQQLVLNVVGKTGVGHREDCIPGIEIARNDLGSESSVPDDVVIRAAPTHIARGEILVRPLMDVLYAPIEAVQVKVIELAMKTGMAKRKHQVAGKLIANALGAITLVNGIVAAHIVPPVVDAAIENERVEALNRRILEH